MAAQTRRRMGAKPHRPQPGAKRPSGLVPFTAAAHKHYEPAFDTGLITLLTTTLAFGPFNVPAYGFMRAVMLMVSTSGGTAGPGVLAADAPFNFFASISLNDVNGAPIFGPYTGYQTLQSNIHGAYAFRSDPRTAPDAQIASTNVVNFQYTLRIPVEISAHDGLGSLPNQNAAASYQVSFTANTIANIWSTAPTTPPSVRVRGFLEAWSLPATHDLSGRPQQDRPPRMGTSQYWSVRPGLTINAGANTIQFTRVGNLWRTIILIFRDGAGARSNTVPGAAFPFDTFEIRWDARQLLLIPQYVLRQYLNEAVFSNTFDAGVFPLYFNNGGQAGGKAGDEDPTLWIPTAQSSRLELVLNNAAAGTLEILTNDVAPVEVHQAERYAEESMSGGVPGARGGGVPVTGV